MVKRIKFVDCLDEVGMVGEIVIFCFYNGPGWWDCGVGRKFWEQDRCEIGLLIEKTAGTKCPFMGALQSSHLYCNNSLNLLRVTHFWA